jgi:hypothetical protein
MHLIADVAAFSRSSTAPTSAVTELRRTTATTTSVTLAWTNPTDASFRGTLIRRSTGDRPPSGLTDGIAVGSLPAGQAAFTDSGLTANTAYSYAVFSRDADGGYLPVARLTTATVQPPLTWSAPQLVVTVNGSLQAVSCAIAGHCVAVDSLGFARVYDNGGWSGASRVDGTTSIEAVSCATTTFCVALDHNGAALTYAGTSWSAPQTVDFGQSGWAVSCPAATFCAATDQKGDIWTYDGHTWQQAPASSFWGLTSVSCSSATFCMAVGPGDFDLKYDGTTWTTVVAPGADVNPHVSCTSPTFCLMVVDMGESSTFDGTWWSNTKPFVPTNLGGGNPSYHPSSVSCLSPTECYAADLSGSGWAFDGTNWVRSSITTGGSIATDPPTSISCASGSFCVAVGATLAAVRQGGVWTTSPASPRNAITQTSCATVDFCVAVGQDGSAYTYDGQSWSGPVAVAPGHTFNALTCPETGFCMVSETDGPIHVLDAGVWTVPVTTPTGLDELSCASRTFCAAGVSSFAVWKYDGTAWSVYDSQGHFLNTGALACVSGGSCLVLSAVGMTFLLDGNPSSGRPIAGEAGSWRNVDNMALSCGVAQLCAAADLNSRKSPGAGGYVDLWDGSAWSGFTRITSSDTANLSGVSCSTSHNCVAIDDQGEVVRWDGLEWATPLAVDPAGALATVACVGPSFCLTIDNVGRVRYGTE